MSTGTGSEVTSQAGARRVRQYQEHIVAGNTSSPTAAPPELDGVDAADAEDGNMYQEHIVASNTSPPAAVPPELDGVDAADAEDGVLASLFEWLFPDHPIGCDDIETTGASMSTGTGSEVTSQAGARRVRQYQEHIVAGNTSSPTAAPPELDGVDAADAEDGNMYQEDIVAGNTSPPAAVPPELDGVDAADAEDSNLARMWKNLEDAYVAANERLPDMRLPDIQAYSDRFGPILELLPLPFPPFHKTVQTTLEQNRRAQKDWQILRHRHTEYKDQRKKLSATDARLVDVVREIDFNMGKWDLISDECGQSVPSFSDIEKCQTYEREVGYLLKRANTLCEMSPLISASELPEYRQLYHESLQSNVSDRASELVANWMRQGDSSPLYGMPSVLWVEATETLPSLLVEVAKSYQGSADEIIPIHMQGLHDLSATLNMNIDIPAAETTYHTIAHNCLLSTKDKTTLTKLRHFITTVLQDHLAPVCLLVGTDDLSPDDLLLLQKQALAFCAISKTHRVIVSCKPSSTPARLTSTPHPQVLVEQLQIPSTHLCLLLHWCHGGPDHGGWDNVDLLLQLLRSFKYRSVEVRGSDMYSWRTDRKLQKWVRSNVLSPNQLALFSQKEILPVVKCQMDWHLGGEIACLLYTSPSPRDS
eukprot:TRINITY_DN2024_c0_g1_i5.p1 TRINITY_DN2024_c0_g1~~TRINITY_DN2024_c0_g1_i5.p1  ORF type:complete len:647 (-),score=57.41 TRINITY_DN2024_c0_g1_i5:164-2104(-)